eukprot:scaffold144224_cov96-Phaeocystis_antarctica.AAC.1
MAAAAPSASGLAAAATAGLGGSVAAAPKLKERCTMQQPTWCSGASVRAAGSTEVGASAAAVGSGAFEAVTAAASFGSRPVGEAEPLLRADEGEWKLESTRSSGSLARP